MPKTDLSKPPAKTGRPRNPRVGDASAAIARLGSQSETGLQYTLAAIDIQDLPDMLRGLPPRAIDVLCLRARGLSFRQIGERLGIATETAQQYVIEYDPQGVFTLGPELRAILSRRDWEIAQAAALNRAMAGIDELSTMQAATMAGISADKLRDIKRLEQEDKRVDLAVDNSSLAGLRSIDVECAEVKPA